MKESMGVTKYKRDERGNIMLGDFSRKTPQGSPRALAVGGIGENKLSFSFIFLIYSNIYI